MKTRRVRTIHAVLCLAAAAAAGGDGGPIALSPGGRSGGTSELRCPTFSWADPAGAGAGYELAVYRVIDGEPAEEPAIWTSLPGGASSWTPSEGCLTPGESYVWSLRPRRAGSEWTEGRLFTISSAPSPREVAAALDVLQRYLDTREPRGPAGPSAGSAAALRQAASDPRRSASPGNLGGNPPVGSEAALRITDGVGDNFGVLIDSFDVPGTEIGLHVGPARYGSLAKNAYFEGGWNRFDTAYGAYLQEVDPDGTTHFYTAAAGPNLIVWREAMRLFGGEVTLFGMRFPLIAGAPSSPLCSSATEGRAYYDPTADVLYLCDGSTWQSH